MIKQKKNIFSSLLINTVKLYQRYYSAYTLPSCRFYPTCSEYAVISLTEDPLYKSLPKIIWRIMRCNPLGGSGIDLPTNNKAEI